MLMQPNPVTSPVGDANPAVAPVGQGADVVEGTHDVVQAELPPLSRQPPPLPYATTDLLGREAELAAIRELIRDHVCVVLRGPGGSGKTRLLHQLSSDLRDTFAQGVCFVSLAALSDPALVLPAIAQALGISESREKSISASLAEEIGRQHICLLLDNADQIIPALADVATLLHRCRHLKVIVTSRTSVPTLPGIDYPVPPLQVPPLADWDDPRRLAHNPAVALFCERAQEVRSDFALTPANSYAVAELCSALGGMPLALELAAAQTTHLAPHVMLDHIHAAQKLQESEALSSRDVVAASIAWSVSLLGLREQVVFTRLAVFAGTFQQSDFAAICTAPVMGPAHSPIAVGLPQLHALCAAGLVKSIEPGAAEATFTMPEPVRDYAARLFDAPGGDDETARRHAHYFSDLAVQAHGQLRGPQQAEWLARLNAAQPNLRVALRYLMTTGDIDRAAIMAGHLARYWNFGGNLSEGRRWLAGILSQPIPSDAAHARALQGAGALAWSQTDFDAAAGYFSASLQLYERLGDQLGVYTALNNLGAIAHTRHEYGLARRYYAQSVQRSRANRDKDMTAKATNNLGMLALAQKQYTRATQYFTESLMLFQELEDARGQAVVLLNLGSIALMAEVDTAGTFFSRGLLLLRHINDAGRQAEALEGLAATAVKKGNIAHAAYLWGHAEILRAHAQTPHTTPDERAFYELAVRSAQQQLDPVLWQAQWRAGQIAATMDVFDIAIAQA